MQQTNIMNLSIGASLALVSSFFIYVFWKNKKLKDAKPPKKQSITEKIITQQKTVQEPVKNKQIRKLEMKTLEQLQKQFPKLYYNSFRVKPQKSIHQITALAFSGSKLLFADTKNQLVLIDLKNLKKDGQDDHSNKHQQRFFVSLDNNTATAIAIGSKYYYASLNFDKTIVYYEFLGGVDGVYFKEIYRFPRNTLKSDAGNMWVPESQQYIVTSGTGADTVIDVWSMKGQKIGHINTYQIQQYQSCFGRQDILIRGWTSEAKLFTFYEQKTGHFHKLEKKMPIALDQSPEYCAIDNLSMYAISISKSHHLKLWPLYSSFLMEAHSQKFIQKKQLLQVIPQLNKCAIYTQQVMSGHFKSIIIIANNQKFILTDINLNTLVEIEGVQCTEIYVTGKKKNAVLGIVGKSGRIIFWNITQELAKCPQIKL